MFKDIFVSKSLKDTLMQALNAEPPEDLKRGQKWEWVRCGKIKEEVPIKITRTMEEVENTILEGLEAALVQGGGCSR